MVIVIVVRQGLMLRATGHAAADALVTTGVVVLPVAVALATLLYGTVERPFLTLRPRYVGGEVPAGGNSSIR